MKHRILKCKTYRKCIQGQVAPEKVSWDKGNILLPIFLVQTSSFSLDSVTLLPPYLCFQGEVSPLFTVKYIEMVSSYGISYLKHSTFWIIKTRKPLHSKIYNTSSICPLKAQNGRGTTSPSLATCFYHLVSSVHKILPPHSHNHGYPV